MFPLNSEIDPVCFSLLWIPRWHYASSIITSECNAKSFAIAFLFSLLPLIFGRIEVVCLYFSSIAALDANDLLT